MATQITMVWRPITILLHAQPSNMRILQVDCYQTRTTSLLTHRDLCFPYLHYGDYMNSILGLEYFKHDISSCTWVLAPSKAPVVSLKKRLPSFLGSGFLTGTDSSVIVPSNFIEVSALWYIAKKKLPHPWTKKNQ